jgi:Protein involved in vacuole import and degradation
MSTRRRPRYAKLEEEEGDEVELEEREPEGEETEAEPLEGEEEEDDEEARLRETYANNSLLVYAAKNGLIRGLVYLQRLIFTGWFLTAFALALLIWSNTFYHFVPTAPFTDFSSIWVLPIVLQGSFPFHHGGYAVCVSPTHGEDNPRCRGPYPRKRAAKRQAVALCGLGIRGRVLVDRRD